MNIETNIDYDSFIDDILSCEERTAETKFIEGTEKSSKNSYEDGFQIGYQKGYSIGLEIGFYDGILTALRNLQESKIILLSDKEHNTLLKLLHLSESFPQINDKNVNIIDQYNEIKGLYKKFCFNLKIKHLDKTIFNFQNGAVEI